MGAALEMCRVRALLDDSKDVLVVGALGSKILDASKEDACCDQPAGLDDVPE